MSYTSNSEFENNHVSYTNEIPPYDYFEGVHSLLTDDIWKWLLGYSEIEYDNDHKDIVDDLGDDPLYEDTDYYHKSVNGTESAKYGPVSKEYFYENLSEDSFIKIAEYSKIKDLNLANYPTISAIESDYLIKLTDLEISTSTYDKLPLKRVTSVEFMTEPGYIYLIAISENMYDKYCVLSKTENDKEYRTLVKLGIKVKYEKYHTMDINGVLLPEEDLFLHEIYRYFETLYPDDPDWVDLLTNNEINDAINNAAAMVNYQPNNNFFELVARNLETNEDDITREAFKIKLRNLTNNAYRRKLYGSRYGYQMFGADIFENLLIYPMGTYIPIKPIDVALFHGNKAVTENNISEFDANSLGTIVPPKTLYNRYVDQYDAHYYNKFRLIDWTGESHNVDKSKNLASYNTKFFAVPGYENYLFENKYATVDFLDYYSGLILSKEGHNYTIDNVETKGDYRVINIGETDESLVVGLNIDVIQIPEAEDLEEGELTTLEESSAIAGENFIVVLDTFLSKTEKRPLTVFPYPLVNNAFITEPLKNIGVYPTTVNLKLNSDINAKERILCTDASNNIEPNLATENVLKTGDYLYVKNGDDPQLHVVQGYERAYLDITFDYNEKYKYPTPEAVFAAAAYAIVVENCNGEDILLYGRIENLECAVATEKVWSQPSSCRFIISAIPESVPEEIEVRTAEKNNRKNLCDSYQYKLYKNYNYGLKLKKVYVYNGTQYESTSQFQSGEITYVNYGYWKAMPIYIEKSLINSVYSPYKYDFEYTGSLFLADQWTITDTFKLRINKALLQYNSSFDFLNKAITNGISHTLTYFNKSYTNITIESKVEIDPTGDNNVISFESDYAKEMFKNLSVGDIVMGPGLPDVNQDIFITSLGDNQVTVNVELTKAGIFNLTFKCSLNAVNSDKFDTEDDFEQRLANIGTLEVMNPWAHGLYGSEAYPNVAGAFLDGLSDIKYFKPFINSGNIVYFTDIIMPALHGNKLEYFPKPDKNSKLVAKNRIIPCTIKYVGDVFVDVSLNKLCNLPNRLGNTDNLITVEWLDYLTDNALELSRASDKVQFGAHLLMETDSSGILSQDEAAKYTDPSVHVTIQTFNWNPNTVPAFAQIGTGGKDGFIKFVSKGQQRGSILWGKYVWNSNEAIDPDKTMILPSVDEASENKLIAEETTKQIQDIMQVAYEEAYKQEYNRSIASGADSRAAEKYADAAGDKAAADARSEFLKEHEDLEFGKGELKSRSMWSFKPAEGKDASYTEIAKPVAQINLGEYDIQLHYDGGQTNGDVDVTTIQANFYKQSFKNIINDDRENIKVAPRMIIDDNFILSDTTKIESLEAVYSDKGQSSNLTEEIVAEEYAFFKGTPKKYTCLGFWTPSLKNNKINWPCNKSILEKAYQEGELYYYIIDTGALFTDIEISDDDDIDIRNDKYNGINSFNTYSVEFADQSILTITPDTIRVDGELQTIYRWSNKKINLIGTFGDLSGNELSSSYDIYPTHENTWINVLLHRALGSVTAFNANNIVKGSGLIQYAGTYAFCPGYIGDYSNETCRSNLSSIVDYLEAFCRYYNDGDGSGRYSIRTGDILNIDGNNVLDRKTKTGLFAELASNVFVLSLIKNVENTDETIDSIYNVLKPGNYGAFIALIPEYNFGTQRITFNIVELSADSFFVQNLKKDKALVSSSEFDYFNSSNSLWQRFNNSVTSKIELPRKMIAEGSYNFDFIIDPEFRGEVYDYDEYVRYLNGEIDQKDLATVVQPITTSAIFYEEDKDIFYIQLQELNKKYCEVSSTYDITVEQLLLARNNDGSKKYSVGDRSVLLLQIDRDKNGKPDNFFITNNGEHIKCVYDPKTLKTTLYRAEGYTFEDGETERVIGENGEAIIALYEDTFESLTAEEISQIEIVFLNEEGRNSSSNSRTTDSKVNIMTDLYENSEFFKALLTSTKPGQPETDPIVYDVSKENETYVAVFKEGVGKKVSGNFQVMLPVAGNIYNSELDDSANTVLVKKFVIPFNENYYYKNLKYLTCNYQLIKSQIPGDEVVTETPTITKVDGEAFDINSLTLTDRLLRLAPVQLRSVENSSLKPTFFSSFTKLKGQLTDINTANNTFKVTYDIGSLVFPDGQTDTSDQMVTLSSRTDFVEQLTKLLPAYNVYNEDTQEDDLIVDSDSLIQFDDYTWHDEKIAAPQVVGAKVSSRFKTLGAATAEFKYFKNLLLVEADVSGADPYTLTLKGNSADAAVVLNSDDTIVSAVPISGKSGEFAKTCAIYYNITGAPLKVDYIYHGNGFIIGTINTRIYYEKVISLEGRAKVTLAEGVSLGSYDGYKVTDISYSDNYFYFTLSDTAGNRVLKRVIGDIDLAQPDDVTDVALSAPVIWTEDIYSDPDAQVLYAKAGDNYIPSTDLIYDVSGNIVTSPQASGKAVAGAIDSGMVLAADGYDKFGNKIGSAGQSVRVTEVYSQSGMKIDKPFTYGTNVITVADWLSDTLNMASVTTTVFDYDIIHGQVPIEHTDYIIDGTGNVVPKNITVYPEFSSMETNSTASPLFATSDKGYEAMLIGKTLFLKSPTATVSEGTDGTYKYTGNTTTFMHWKKVDLPVSLNNFRNSFKTLSDDEFYTDITEVFNAISTELSSRRNSETANAITAIEEIITDNFKVDGHIITLDEFTAKHQAVVASGSSTGATFRIEGVSYSNGVASLGPLEYVDYSITPDASVPANETYNSPHYAYTYREMILDFVEYVCGAADNTKLFTESAIKMYFEDDSLYIQTSNRDILSISEINMTKRPDLENPRNWTVAAISSEVSILSRPDDVSSYRLVYQGKDNYIQTFTTRAIHNFTDIQTSYNAGSMKFMGGKLDSATTIKSFLDTITMPDEDKHAFITNLYASEHYNYISPILLMSVDGVNYLRVRMPELTVNHNGRDLVVGKDFGAYISSIKKIGNYIYALVKADFDNSGIYSPIPQALRIMKNGYDEWSLSSPTTDNPATSPYDILWVDITTAGISNSDLNVFANASDFVTSGTSKLGYNNNESFSSFTYPSILNSRLNDAELGVVKVVNGKVLLNGPLCMSGESDMTFLIAFKTSRQVYDQSDYLNSENYNEYTSNGKFLVDSVMEVTSPREADRMYNKREVMVTPERPEGMSAEEFINYTVKDNDGYPSVAEDRYHVYYKYDIYGEDYYVKDWYNKDHNEIKLCNIDGDYFVQNNASTPVAVRYADAEKLLRTGTPTSVAFNAPYAEYNSIAAASRDENARPLDAAFSSELTAKISGIKEICLDNDNPYMILEYNGDLMTADYNAVRNYEKYVEFNIYVPYTHASEIASSDNMLFNVTKTWKDVVLNEGLEDERTEKRLESGVIADLADGLPVSAIYIPMRGYGSTRDNTIDWDKQDNYKPWTIDPKAFEYYLDTAGTPVFRDLKNSVNKPVYLCNANGELIKDSEGNFIPVKVPKYLDIGSLVTGENGYEIEYSLVKTNEVLGGLDNSRNSIGYIEQISPSTGKFTLKEKLSLNNMDLNDGEKHVIMFTLLTVEPVTLNPKVMNNPEYFIAIEPHEKNIFGYDRICWNEKGYPRSPVKIGNDIFYSENNSKYEPNLFSDPFGTPVYECDKNGYFIGFAKKKVGDEYQLVEKGRLDNEKEDGDLSKFVTAAHDYRFRPYTPKYSSCQDWFRDEFYLSGQEKNPYWQVIHIQANYNSNTMQYEQISKVQEYVKVGSTMNLKDLSADESYVTVRKPTRITTVKGVKFIETNAPYLDCKRGLIDMILIPAAQGTKYNPIFEEGHRREDKDLYVKYGISARIPWGEVDATLKNIFDTNIDNLTSVHSYFCGSWSVNTLENFVDKTDKDKAITQIDELGIFDTQGNLIIYATFPAIEYRTDTQHVDFTIIVNNGKNTINKLDATPSIESE